MERYVDIKSVSKYTSLPVSTLYEWAGQGKIPSLKIGRRVLFDLKDIDKIMNSVSNVLLINVRSLLIKSLETIMAMVYNDADSDIQALYLKRGGEYV